MFKLYKHRLNLYKLVYYQHLSTFHLNKFKAIDLNNRSDQKQEERHENNQKQQQTNFRRIFTVGCVISSLFLCPRKMLFAHEDQTKPPNRRMMFNFIADVVEDVLPSTVKIELKQHGMFGSGSISNGSGFIISSDGLIITNAHVIRDQSSNPIVELHGGRTFKSKVIKIDKFLDLALIKIECKNLKPVKLGDSNQVRTGEFVVALGNPLTLNNTVTSGIVSNPKRDGTELGLSNELFYIQTDTIVTHGNSGGPLVNLDGEVIGVNSMTATPGISFAIPSQYLKDFIKEPKTFRKRQWYLGMKMISITPQICDFFAMQIGSDIQVPRDVHNGCLVIEVAPYSPAEKAGLKRGDIILKANDMPVSKNYDLLQIVATKPQCSLVIRRQSSLFTVDITAIELK